MDVGTNKTRKDTRAVVSLVARYRSPSTFEYVEEACCDVSLGGMFIRSKDPAAAGTLLKLECESGVGAQIRGVARVVWLRAQTSEYGPSGMGVKFVKLDPESRDVITRLVQELVAAGIESPSMSSAPEDRGKPPVKRGASSTPAAAEEPPPQAAALVSNVPPRAAADSEETALAPRQSEPPATKTSSRPPALPPPVSSRPAPSHAVLARASMDDTDVPSVNTGRTSMHEIARDLGPLQPMLRAARASAPPPSDNERGRAFWLVAGAVVALGGIVALFSMRAAREGGPEEANRGASPAVQAPAPPPTSADEAEPEPSAPNEAEGAATTQAQGLAADIAAQQAELAKLNADGSPQLDQATIPDTAASAHVAQVPVATPEGATPATPASQTTPASDVTRHAAAPAPTPSSPAPAPASAPAQPKPAASASPQPSAAQTAQPPAAAQPVAPEVPVLRITPAADPAPVGDKPAAPEPQKTGAPSPQPTAATATAPSAPATQPIQPAAAPTQPAAAQASNPPAALAPGEIAHVITFTSRPSGASVFVGDRTVVTPGELNLGAMPPRIRITAQKEGFESSTVWINNVAEFQKVGDVLRREVHFVLPTLPAQPQGTAPAQAKPPAPAAPAPQATAPAPTQGPSTPPAPAQP